MKNIRHYLFVAMLLGSVACTEDFTDINTNPNAPITVQPSLLLRQVIWDYGEQMSYEGFVAGNLLGQYLTAIDFNLFDRHSLTEPQFGGNPWPILYTNLRDNDLILEQVAANPTLAVYEGPARVLKAYMAMTLTDIYGDVPYTEALRGKAGNVTPRYDAQADIYMGTDGVLDNLDKAIALLGSYTGGITLQGDILYNGDLAGWARLAHALKIKALMRIAGRVDVAAELQALYDGGNYIQTNAQNATFRFTDGQPNNFRMANLRAGDFNLFILSETMAETLELLDDPRRAVWYRPIGNDPTQTVFAGLRNGPNASETSISVANYSLSGTVFREQTGRLSANYLTAWETHFLLAEAAERGLISADAKALYDLAVAQAFDYWQTPLPTGYLTTGPATYGRDGADKLAQILTQKWMANIVNGYEGWIEYRRTGYPALKPVAASLNDGLLPVRMPYPTDEAALNTANFNAAASATQGNSVNSAVWWDVE